MSASVRRSRETEMPTLRIKEQPGLSVLMLGGSIITVCLKVVGVALKGYVTWNDMLITLGWIPIGYLGLWLRKNPVFEIADGFVRVRYPLRRLEVSLSNVQHWKDAKNRRSIIVVLNNGESKTVWFPLGHLEEVEQALQAYGLQKIPSTA